MFDKLDVLFTNADGATIRNSGLHERLHRDELNNMQLPYSCHATVQVAQLVAALTGGLPG
jgi:hypothetical protein